MIVSKVAPASVCCLIVEPVSAACIISEHDSVTNGKQRLIFHAVCAEADAENTLADCCSVHVLSDSACIYR